MRGNTIHDVLSVHALGVEENILLGPGKLKKPTSSSTDVAIEVTRTRVDPVTYYTGIKTKASITLTGNSANAISEGGRFEASITGAFDLTSTDYGLRGATLIASHGGSGTVDLATGAISLVQNTSGGILTTGFCHITASGDNSGAGSITNLVGHAVANQSDGTNNTILMLGTLTPAAGNYAVYCTSTYASYFAGAVSIDGNITNAVLTASRLVVSDGSKNLASNAALNTNGFIYASASGGIGTTAAATDGQLLIGDTGSNPIAAALTGTANQVVVTNGAGSITLSLPQNIHTAATPTFSNLTLSARTATRIAFFGLGGAFSDSANLIFTSNQLQLAATGSTTGILIGGDTQLYRSAADVLYLPDTLQIVPPNFTLAAADQYGVLLTSTGAPAADTANRVFGLSFNSIGSTNFNYSNATGGITGLQAAAQHTGNGTVTAMTMGIFSGSSGGTGTVTTMNQIYCLGYDISTGSTLTTWNGCRVDTPRASGAGVATTVFAFVCHPRTMTGTFTASYGLGIYPNGNMNAHSHNAETRVGIAIGAMPDPGAFTTPTTIALWISCSSNPTTARDAIVWGSSKDTNLYRSAASTLKTDSAFVVAGTLAVTGNTTLSGTCVVAKALSSGVVALTDAATIAVDASLGNHFRVTLGGNRTLGNPTNAVDGQKLTFEIVQDGTGTRTLAYDTKFIFGTDIASITLTTTASKRDFIGAIYLAASDKFAIVSVSKGYA